MQVNGIEPMTPTCRMVWLRSATELNLHIGNKLATSAAALARINLRSNFTLDALIQLIGLLPDGNFCQRTLAYRRSRERALQTATQ